MKEIKDIIQSELVLVVDYDETGEISERITNEILKAKPELGCNIKEVLAIEPPDINKVLINIHDQLVKIEPLPVNDDVEETVQLIETLRAQLYRISGIPEKFFSPEKLNYIHHLTK